jgi:WXG100 family type VII secretion target
MFNGGNMPAAIVRSDRDALKDIETNFKSESDRVGKVSNDIRSKYSKLKDGDWVGEAATKFFQRMDDEVLPELKRLQDAMNEAASVTQKISKEMQELEDRSSRIFIWRLG